MLPLLILAVLVACMAPVATWAGSPLVDSHGLWTLERLGYDDVVFGVEARTALGRRELVYRLPANASQGVKTWYALRYHFRVSIHENAIPGTFSVSADTNGRTCASIIFEVDRTPQGLRLTSDSLGLVDGHEVKTSRGLTQEIDFRNYLQYRGVRPGRNVLTFRITANALPLVRSVRIFSDTGIEASPLGPARIELRAQGPRSTVEVGESFRIRFELRLAEGRPVDDASLRISYPGDRLELQGETERKAEWRSRAPLNGSFAFTALEPGPVTIALSAEAGGDNTSTQATVTAVDSTSGSRRRALVGLAATVATIAAAVATLAAVRRRP